MPLPASCPGLSNLGALPIWHRMEGREAVRDITPSAGQRRAQGRHSRSGQAVGCPRGAGMTPMLGWCICAPLPCCWRPGGRALDACGRAPGAADLGRAGLRVTQSTLKPAEPGRPALPPGVWVLPWSRAGSGVPFPWLGPEAPRGESWQQPGDSLPHTTSAAAGWPQNHPITKACGALRGSAPTLGSRQGYLCQRRLTAKVPSAAGCHTHRAKK